MILFYYGLETAQVSDADDDHLVASHLIPESK